MTIETGRLCFWLCCSVLLSSVVLIAHGCTGASKVRHGDAVDVSSYPKDIQDAYEVFAVRCSRCHTLARPLNAHIHDAQHWERYVARMRRNPSSGINEKNAGIIIRFLLYYMHQQDKAEGELDEPSTEPADAPVRPASAPSSATSGALEGSAMPDETETGPAHGDQPPPATAPEGKP
jgi:hypothetical protein